ncbi:MAG TPA: sulfatase-like hydrolase/transferase [Vicinamibacterales bacterium]|nr:sulfatase-like hydrolase/transferase [Vicinamibacterales bacterium]
MKRAAVVLILVAAAGGFLAWQKGWVGTSAPRIPNSSSRRPNVVLITIDTLRADRVGRGLTPAIDRLAGRGTTFTNVRATAPLTLPSHVSLMTGTMPPVHGVRENGAIFDRQTPTIARRFKDAGYRTGAFVGAYVLNRRFGLDDGFETYDDAVRRNPTRAEQLEAERPAVEVIDAALAWLQRPAPDLQRSASSLQPFFLWVHLYDPHAPYAPPPAYRQAGGHAYDGEVAYADAQVGRLLDALEAGGLAASTVVAVTGDHGESLGEHGEATHGMLAYDAALRVPLVIAVPAAVRDHNAAPMSLADLAPLLLREAGLGAARPPAPVYAESRYPRRVGWHALSALADDRWKLIRSSETELYEIAADPAEQRNVAADHPGVVTAMAAALQKIQAGARSPAAIAPEAGERLRALGYASGSSPLTIDDPAAPNPARVIAAWTTFEHALGRLQAGEAAAAAGLLKRLVEQHPGAPVFHSTYARSLLEAGDPRAAVPVYKAAVARWPGDAALFHDLAVAAREAGDLQEAARAEQAALALDSTSAMAQNGLGLLHIDAGRSAEAAAAFERAARQDPTNASYWTNLGNARRSLDDPAGAERAYRRALEADGEFADALNGLGALRVQAGRSAEAVPLFERALKRHPQLQEARLNLGIAYQESGQRERAAAVYRELLATAPASAARERKAAAELLKGLR